MENSITSIKAFHKENRGKAVSTTHTMTFAEYMEIAKQLSTAFKKYSVDVNAKNVKVVIPYH